MPLQIEIPKNIKTTTEKKIIWFNTPYNMNVSTNRVLFSELS